MSHELLYTSAPRGLQPGSRGFCTVSMTQGLPGPLLEKLEQLSGYRALFPPHDPKAPLNPVAYAHVRLTLGGRSVRVLSRVCAAGLDYTQRTNTFAHHVVLDAAELPAGGPAWLASQPGFLEAAWDGEVHLLPAGRTVPLGDVAPMPCDAWEEITGDAGWAGVLVEAFLADPIRPAYLVFDAGVDPLPLLVEALALLPPERRWEVTFSTYFTGLPQGATCAWRCVVRGTPEAKTRVPGSLVLSLSMQAGVAPESPGAAAARVGLPVEALTASDSEEDDNPIALCEPVFAPDDRSQPTPRASVPARPEAFALSNPDTLPIPAARPPGIPQPVRPTPRQKPGRKVWAWGFVAGLLGGVLVTGGVIGGLWLSAASEFADERDENTRAQFWMVLAAWEQEQELTQKIKTLEGDKEQLEGDRKKLKEQVGSLQNKANAVTRLEAELKKKNQQIAKLMKKFEPVQPPVTASKKKEQPPPPPKPPDEAKSSIALLPSSQTGRQEWNLLETLKVASLLNPKMTLRGLGKIPGKEAVLISRPEGDFLVACVRVENDDIPLCDLRIEGNQLQFRWEYQKPDKVKEYHEYVRILVLEIQTSQQESHYLALRKPSDTLSPSATNRYRINWGDQGIPKGTHFLANAQVRFDSGDYQLASGAKDSQELHTSLKKRLSKPWEHSTFVLGKDSQGKPTNETKTLKGSWELAELRVLLDSEVVSVQTKCMPNPNDDAKMLVKPDRLKSIVDEGSQKGLDIHPILSELVVYIVVDGIRVPVFKLGKEMGKSEAKPAAKKPAAVPPEKLKPKPVNTTIVDDAKLSSFK